jgi:heterotetrameric sarcosine oxidase delta subunit
MLLIPCPWCGPRAQVEFAYGGDASVGRPAPDATEAEWFAYVYVRANPLGPHAEWWQHTAGCRRWFRLRRDTRTHEIAPGADVAARPPEAAR